MVYTLNLEMRDLLKVAARAPVAAIDSDTQVRYIAPPRTS
jgi:hypothetical protein